MDAATYRKIPLRTKKQLDMGRYEAEQSFIPSRGKFKQASQQE
jgi:hypothetical protein